MPRNPIRLSFSTTMITDVKKSSAAEGGKVFIRSSDQLLNITALKRCPVPRNFNVTPESRTERGKAWPAPAGTTRLKRFEIYRYDPDSDQSPRIDTARAQVTDDRVASVEGRKEGARDSFLPRPWEGEERAANSFLPLQGGGLRWESSSYPESIISRWDHVRRPRT